MNGKYLMNNITKKELIEILNTFPDDLDITYKTCISGSGLVTTTFEVSYFNMLESELMYKSVPTWNYLEYPGRKYWK